MTFKVQLTYTATITSGKSEFELLAAQSTYVDFGKYDFESFLDEEVVKTGITGGLVAVCNDSEGIRLTVGFWMSFEPNSEFNELLIKAMYEQLLDGIGENGFHKTVNRTTISAEVEDAENPKLKIEKSDRSIPPPPLIAIAAKQNDAAKVHELLRAEQQGINRLFQGYSALHYAIFGNDAILVKKLLDSGADANVRDVNSATPLTFLAATRVVSDANSCVMAQDLLQAGAKTDCVDYTERTPAEIAEVSGKLALVKILQS